MVEDDIWPAVDAAREWLDQSNGTLPLELTCRILKVTEEAGEAVQAWIDLLGQNPRKGVTHTREDVAAELADVAFTALVAIASLGLDPQAALAACATKVRARFPLAPHPAPADPATPIPGEATAPGSEPSTVPVVSAPSIAWPPVGSGV
ncbi:MazG-like family protein [Paractinoplanes abujensis]|uniref:Phosphoribosyl-ATP pyrophosphohydrolase n=1 Tax=Paractinoplanes abujensis TaxID=882441 RepID=A0A7W7CL00_9ACTN|nr:MazG-like family protein [Actinoplanes abujensis]MBB4690448.1 phosphoribosyl-ATP pyrophosphohydrolase [Actinoplanes abujensis]